MSNTTIVDVGTAPVDIYRPFVKSQAEVYFHNIRGLDDTCDSFVESSPFSCVGDQWKLRLYPGGVNGHQNSTAVGIESCSGFKFRRNVQLSLWGLWLGVKPATHLMTLSEETFDEDSDADEMNIQIWSFRSIVSQCSSLLVKVEITSDDVLYHQPNCDSGMLTLLGDRETADVAFQTEDEVLYAHKVILKKYAPSLYDLCETYDDENPMPVNDVDSGVFLPMLSTLYGDFLALDDWNDDLKLLLKAADKYGFTHLKIEVEKWYVHMTDLTVDNVIRELFYADASGHAFAKEAAMEFIKENTAEVLSSGTFAMLHQSERLVKDVIIAMKD